MGATLELTRVSAKSWKEAVNKVVDVSTNFYGLNPYSGSFNTISDWKECKKSFNSEDEFEDWVCENGDKREAYVWKKGTKYVLCGWCAC